MHQHVVFADAVPARRVAPVHAPAEPVAVDCAALIMATVTANRAAAVDCSAMVAATVAARRVAGAAHALEVERAAQAEDALIDAAIKVADRE